MALAAIALSLANAPKALAQGAPIETSAEFALIMDYETGAILFEKNADRPTAPASMSKLMTVAIVLEKLQAGELTPETEFAVSEKAWRMGGSKMWVRVDTKISIANLLRGVIVQSGNDACIVIAENIAGTEEAFAELMNRKAREWGLDNSRFANASGWPDPNQKMSMRDLGKLARKIIAEYPEYYALFSEREFTWEKIRQPNRNPILEQFNGADGLKTGHTEESGYGLVASALVGGQRRILVLNGLESEKARARESARLLRAAFNDFENKKVFKAGAMVGVADVFAGKKASVPLVAGEDVSMILHRSYMDDVRATVVYRGPVAAPIRKNQQIGYLKVATPGADPREYPLYAGDSVSSVGALGRIGLAAAKIFGKPPSPDAGS